MNVKGYLDGLKGSTIEGWCFNTEKLTEPLLLHIYINGEYKGSVEANEERLGLKEKGLHPNGNCGFKFDIEALKPEDVTKIEVKTKIGRLHLKNSPMNINTNRLKIFYMHIPKTAGSSLNADISLNFPLINKKTHIEGVLGSEEEPELYSKNFLSGHLSFPKIIEKFAVDKWDFITLLRKPIDQLESHINWVLKVTEDKDSKFHKGHGTVIQKMSAELRAMNLKTDLGKTEFVLKVKTSHHFRNLFENCQTKYFIGTNDRFVNSHDLYNALKVLQSSFLLTGVSDDYNGFLKELTKHFGFDYVAPKEKKNINKKKQRFFETPEDLELVSDLIKFDNILYDYAKLKWKEISNKEI